eukprot:4541225-Alexandrium_andersonii.AAC.1
MIERERPSESATERYKLYISVAGLSRSLVESASARPTSTAMHQETVSYTHLTLPTICSV